MHNAVLSPINRRRALTFFGAAGIAAIMRADARSAADATACVATAPAMTEGPYWVDEKLFRSDIRTDPATGLARPGVPLNLSIAVQNAASGGCAPLAGALVDIWHCDAIGIYSDESAYNPGGGTGTVVTTGQKFLRGYQVTDDSGQVKFLTIYPGWYSGRTIHIHIRVRTYSGTTVLDNFVTQVFFDDTISNAVLSQAPYTRTTARDTRNSNDMVYTGSANSSRMLLALTQTSTGYDATVTIGVNMKAPAAAAPAIAAGGIANAASGAAGIAPNAWTSIYGTNLAAVTHTMTSDQAVNGNPPATLSGVSVKIDGQDAGVYFVSPTQLNVLAPDDTVAGAVPVIVTNASGTSTSATANLQPVLPGLFTVANYVRAAPAKPGDAIELYGTGFGTSGNISVIIAGLPAPVLYAGLVGPGLHQINVTVPVGLADGDHPVVATVATLSTQSTALLKTAA